jgi:hypothetical protein
MPAADRLTGDVNRNKAKQQVASKRLVTLVLAPITG